MNKIRLLLADDHTVFRKSLRGIIDRQTDMTVVGEAKDGVEAVDRAKELAADIILMDIRMPILDGVKATRLIKAQDEGVGIVILTMYPDDEYVFEALKAGARGYVLKDADRDELLEAIRSVHRGEPAVDASIAGRVLVEICKLTRSEGIMQQTEGGRNRGPSNLFIEVCVWDKAMYNNAQEHTIGFRRKACLPRREKGS